MTLQLRTPLLPEDLSCFPEAKGLTTVNFNTRASNTLFWLLWALYTGGPDICANLVYWTYTPSFLIAPPTVNMNL